MILELHDKLQKPLVITATRLLITFDDGTPYAFAIDYAPNHARLFRAGDPNFAEQLHIHGFDRTVIVDNGKLKG